MRWTRNKRRMLWMCVCVCVCVYFCVSYLACKVHISCYLWPVRLCYIFHVIWRFFGKKLLIIKRVVQFSQELYLKYWLSRKNLARYYHKYTEVLMLSTCYTFQTLLKLEFSRHIFLKISNSKYNENTSVWVPSCSMRTDRQIWQSQ